MKHLVILHGAILKKSTFAWTRALSEHFEALGFQCHRYFWAGIPIPALMRKACASFEYFYHHAVRHGMTYIYAKSLGADIVNYTYPRLKFKPKRILFVAPVFQLSSQVYCDSGDRLFTVRLAQDRFIQCWERFGVAHQLHIPGKEFVAFDNENIDHHKINWNTELLLQNIGRMKSYDLYERVFEIQNTNQTKTEYSS